MIRALFCGIPQCTVNTLNGRCIRRQLMIFWAQMRRLPHEDDKSVELPRGYELDAAGTNLLLKRPSGFLIAAFGEGVSKDSIRHVAEADERYLRAIQRQEEFGSAADSETVLMFAADVREARTEFLLTLEVVYRGEDVRPANDGSLVS
jgi:hypothetical protein